MPSSFGEEENTADIIVETLIGSVPPASSIVGGINSVIEALRKRLDLV